MACRITELVLDCRDPEALSRWWCDVLDWVELDREGDLSIEIGPREGFGGAVPTLVFNLSEDPRRGKLPLHLDVSATDRDQAAELERLLELGARRSDVGQTGTESWVVLADPEGNEFCLLRRQVEPL
jgi:hypothetical protein